MADDLEGKLKHLELIQDVINRMASNSFQLKGWSVVLVSAIFAVAASISDSRLFALAYLPALGFWILDAYFLQQERLFRRLYDHVRALPSAQIDFGMATSPFRKDVQSWRRTAFSTTLLVFHGIVLGVVTLALAVSTIAPVGGPNGQKGLLQLPL